jgi:lipopolysaccharide export system protein LptA
MRPTTPLITAVIALLACAPAHAQLSRESGPIELAADFAERVDAENLVRLRGRVNVRQGEARLAADTMDVYFKPGGEGENRDVERIEADGAVVYVTPFEVARGDHGIYVASGERITLTGDVTLVRGESTLAGSELVIESATGRSYLTNSGRQSESDGRVRAIINSADTPDSEEDSSEGEAE